MFPIRDIRCSSAVILLDSLTNDDSNYLGSGTFASVYKSADGRRAYKIIHKADSAYMQFLVNLSEQTEQNPFLPVIYSVTNVNDGDHVLVSMELLKALPKAQAELVIAFHSILNTTVPLPSNKDTLERAVAFLQSIAAECTGIFFDVHKDNIMLRGTQPVMTDVLCNKGDF